ncbi:MAG: nitrate reductase cytochrome c-type subunit [Gallionellaceae bacterium]
MAACIVMVAGTGVVFAGATIQSNDMGLSKGSVFDTPVPKVYHYNTTPPGESKVLPRAYLNAPPQVSHDVSDFLPITAQTNMCVACHNQPALWGKKLKKNDPTPIPPSHYTDLRNAPGKVTENLTSARYNCNQCHVPQTDAPALVENTFASKKAR